jgi:hypothetical protein
LDLEVRIKGGGVIVILLSLHYATMVEIVHCLSLSQSPLSHQTTNIIIIIITTITTTTTDTDGFGQKQILTV